MAKQESGKPYSHFVTRFRLSGDIERAKLLVKTGERQMGILRTQLRFHDLFQGYRDFEPFSGSMINCSIVGTVRLVEIYVQPTFPVEIKKKEERPCFCNCCLAECQIAKVDGTWRDNSHYDIPLPDLQYKHGDRRLRYDVDVCSFMGISAETGLLTHEFYRLENVMPSDFTPYEVGDWAMIYFTDLERTTECSKCENCTPPIEDEMGRVWGCLQRDVALYLNSPQCVILPIAINDRTSRPSVMFRSIAELQSGVCIKKCVIDWVQYSTRDQQGQVVDGYANIRWDAWPSTPSGTVVDGVAIHYCTQDGTNDDGSHAFRWGNEVYLFMEGETWTVLGHVIEDLPTYKAPYADNVRMINPAMIVVSLSTYRGNQQEQDVDSGLPADLLAIAWDFTHDEVLSFTKYAWAEEEITMPTTPESLSRLISVYFTRGACDPPATVNYISEYGDWPSSSWYVKDGEISAISGENYLYESSHTHGILAGYTGIALDMYEFLQWGVQWALDSEGFVYHRNAWSTSANGTQTQIPSLEVPADGSDDGVWGEYYILPPGSQPFGAKNGWSWMQHSSGWCNAGWYVWGMSVPNYTIKASTSTGYGGKTISMGGFPASFNRQWFGLMCNALCSESCSSTENRYSFSAAYTWEYEDVFYGRASNTFSIFSGSAACICTPATVSNSVVAADGLPGLILANTSSLSIKLVEVRSDSVTASSERARGSLSVDPAIFSGPWSSRIDGVGTRSNAEISRYVRLELGANRSRYHDPFTDGTDGTPYVLWDKPVVSGEIVAAVASVPVRFQHVRDYYLNGGDRDGTYRSWYEASYWMEDRVQLHIL